MRAPLLVLFFLSGFAALTYELVWFQQVQLVVGVSSFSIAAILASFMGGMALGSAAAPRIISPRVHPLAALAGLELGIAIIGALIPVVMPAVRGAYVEVAGYGPMGLLLRTSVAAIVLLPPTMLMGATLPVVSRWTGAGREGSATIGLLYMANIAGGACGTAVAGFYILRVFDVIAASGVAVLVNVLVAAAFFMLSRLQPYTPATAQPETNAPTANTEGVTRIYLVAGLSGFTSLGAEVVWTRQLSLLFGASVYTFSLILTVFLTGLGIGSFIGSALARRSANARTALGMTQLLLALAIAGGAWTIVDVLPHWQPTHAFLPGILADPFKLFAYDALRCGAAMLPATILWGASFPLAIAAAGGAAAPAVVVSRINAVNTFGALAGAIGLTLWGIPLINSQHAQQLLAAAAGISAALAFQPREDGRPNYLLGALTVATLVAMWVVPPVPAALIAYGRSVDSYSTTKQYLYVAEGASSSIAVTETTSGARQFHIAGKVEASNMDIDMRLERMLGHIPALVHPQPRSVLIVGVGAGVTAGALVIHPEVERIVVCELEPVVPASARRFFASENHHVFDDPRVEIVFDDARHFLQTTHETFDIITSDPIHPWVRGAATLYSLEYLQLARAHLNPGGVVTQWVPLYETDPASVKSELATFAQVFPDTTLWNPDLSEEGYDLVALGRVREAAISELEMDRRIADSPDVAQSLAEVSLGSAGAVLSTYAGRGRDLAPWLADAVINRERHLRLQYLAGLAANQDQRYAIFQAILQYRRYPADLFVASAGTESRLRGWYDRPLEP